MRVRITTPRRWGVLAGTLGALLVAPRASAARADGEELPALGDRAQQLTPAQARAILELDLVAHLGLGDKLATPAQRAAHRRSRVGRAQLRELQRTRQRLLRQRLLITPRATIGGYDAQRRGLAIVVGRDAARLIAADGKDPAPALPDHCLAHDAAAAFCFPQLPIREQDVPFSVDSGDGGGSSRLLVLPATRRQAAAIDRGRARVHLRFTLRPPGGGARGGDGLRQLVGRDVEALVADGDRVLLRRRFR